MAASDSLNAPGELAARRAPQTPGALTRPVGPELPLLPDLRLRQRDYLLKVTKAMSARLDLREVLAIVIRYAVDITGGRAGAVAMRGPRGKMDVVASYQLQGAYRDQIDAVLSRELWRRDGEPVEPEVLEPTPEPEELVTLPLSVGDEVIGEVFIFRSEGAAAYTPLDHELLAAFADQAAVAIHNARLYAELSLHADEVQRLHDLSLELLKADTMDAALGVASRHAAMLAGGDWAAVLIPEGEGSERAATASYPHEGGPGDLAGVWAATAAVLASGELATYPDLAGDRSVDGLAGLFGSAAGAPVTGATGPVGAVWVARHAAGPFRASALQLLATLAQTLGLALDRLRLVEELASRQQQLGAIIDSHPSGLLVLDRAGRVSAVNPAASRLLQRPEARIQGAEVGAAVALLAEESRVPIAIDLPPGTEPVVYRGFVHGPSHGPFVQLTLTTLAGAAGLAQGYLGELVDLSEYKAQEAAKSAFLAGLSHELKTPLSLIWGYAETLGHPQVQEDRELRDRALEVILAETGRLTEIVNRMLGAARVQAGALELDLDEVDLEAMLERQVDDFRQVHRRFLWEFIGAKVGTVTGDPLRLREVFNNLLSNAAKFSDAGSLIRVESSASDGWIQVTVSDEGIGIDPKDHTRIFERFVRGTKRGEGTGLGLYLVRAIVEAHGGTVAVESQPGRGSTFVVRLPRRGPAPAGER